MPKIDLDAKGFFNGNGRRARERVKSPDDAYKAMREISNLLAANGYHEAAVTLTRARRILKTEITTSDVSISPEAVLRVFRGVGGPSRDPS